MSSIVLLVNTHTHTHTVTHTAIQPHSHTHTQTHTHTQAANLATRLQDPKVALPVGSTTAALSLALYNYHITLEVRSVLLPIKR